MRAGHRLEDTGLDSGEGRLWLGMGWELVGLDNHPAGMVVD